MNISVVSLGCVSNLAIGEQQLRAPVRPAASPSQWFEPQRWLGKRGFKYFSAPTRYWLAAVTQALAAAELEPDEATSDEYGVALGTNFAAHALLREMDRTLAREGVAGLSPMNSPNFSINIPASVSAMKAQLRALCLTLTTPHIAGLQAIHAGARALRERRASSIVAGGVEAQPDPDSELAEGACALVLEPEARALARGAEPMATLVGGFDGLVERGALQQPDAGAWHSWWSAHLDRFAPPHLKLGTRELIVDLQTHGLGRATADLLRRAFICAARERELSIELAIPSSHAEQAHEGALGAVVRSARWLARSRSACIIDVNASGQLCSLTLAAGSEQGGQL